MKRMIGPAGLAIRGCLAFLAIGLVVSGGCKCKQQPAPPGLLGATKYPTHAPPFKLQPDLILQRKADFMHHVTTELTFASGTAVDDRRLLEMQRGVLQVGPHAVLVPETGASDLDSSFAWADTGRVLATITLSANYDKLKLKQGLTYVCVVRGARHQWGDIWAILAHVVNNGVADTASLPLAVKHKTGPARWFTGPTDDDFCIPCDTRYCCSSQD